MPCMKVRGIGKRDEWLIGVGEIIISSRFVRDRNALDIGERVLELISLCDEVQPYFQGGQNFQTESDFRKFQEDRVLQKAKKKGIGKVRLDLQKDYFKVFVLLGRRDGFRCVKCGSEENLEIDHKIPISRGGTNEFGNLQLMCKGHNLEKSNKV